MAHSRKSSRKLSDDLARRRKISVPEAAAILNVHPDTFKKHYPNLVQKIGPRLERVNLADVLAI